jgi:hypothetical protein
MTAATLLNEVREIAHTLQLLNDNMCKSFVSIPWPSTLYCVNRGVFSSTKHIGVEYTRVECQWTLFLLTTLVWIALIFHVAEQFKATFRTARVPPDGLPWPQVMATCVNVFNLNSNITITTIPHSMPRSTAVDERTESAQNFTDVVILYTCFIWQLWCLRRFTCH